jgi:hypothetical protein
MGFILIVAIVSVSVSIVLAFNPQPTSYSTQQAPTLDQKPQVPSNSTEAKPKECHIQAGAKVSQVFQLLPMEKTFEM